MITIICSTNRKNSVSKKISHLYQNILESKDQPVDVIYLEDMPDDFIASALYENAGSNEEFNDFRKKMFDTQKMVFIVPEYNGSFPGVLKTFIDGLQFPGTFKNKKCALVGLSSGVQGGGLALSHLTDIFNYCGTHVLALKPKLSRIEENLTENSLSKLYHELLEEQAQMFIEF
ncbi:MAG: chromate reductase [Cyclobacteriaceae bacterium]|jgi:chromate reductase